MTQALIGGTTTNKATFAEVFRRLALSFNAEPSPDKAEAYWAALQDLPLEALTDAVARLQREGGRKWFPTTGEWREAAEQALAQRLRQAVQPARDEPWHLECAGCEDTGWLRKECSSAPCICGRPRRHAPHTFVVPCPCRPTNRTYTRTRAFGSGAV